MNEQSKVFMMNMHQIRGVENRAFSLPGLRNCSVVESCVTCWVVPFTVRNRPVVCVLSVGQSAITLRLAAGWFCCSRSSGTSYFTSIRNERGCFYCSDTFNKLELRPGKQEPPSFCQFMLTDFTVLESLGNANARITLTDHKSVTLLGPCSQMWQTLLFPFITGTER